MAKDLHASAASAPPRQGLTQEVRLLGSTSELELWIDDEDQSFSIIKRGYHPMTGRITQNKFGLFVLPFDRIDKSTGQIKSAHAHLEAGSLCVDYCNISVPVDTRDPAFTRLLLSRSSVPAVSRSLAVKLRRVALESVIVSRFKYQLTSGFILFHKKSRSFTLAYINMAARDEALWQFCASESTEQKSSYFVRFMELTDHGFELTRATAVISAESRSVRMEFDFHQVVLASLEEFPDREHGRIGFQRRRQTRSAPARRRPGLAASIWSHTGLAPKPS
jgi:hypothetical protein